MGTPVSIITFHCSQHDLQAVDNISVGVIPSIPVRITLKCGCSWIWKKDMTWEQQTMSNGLQARTMHAPEPDC